MRASLLAAALLLAPSLALAQQDFQEAAIPAGEQCAAPIAVPEGMEFRLRGGPGITPPGHLMVDVEDGEATVCRRRGGSGEATFRYFFAEPEDEGEAEAD